MRKCLPFRHDYKAVAAYEVEDISFGIPGLHYTNVLLKCKDCSKVKSKRLEGYWTLADINYTGSNE